MSERGARWTAARVALLAADGLVGITAVGGGLALATGLEASNFGPELLETTPFESYVGPGLILATAIGGSAAGAAVATIRRPDLGGRLSIVAAGILGGWILGEMLLLEQPTEPTLSEATYLAAAVAMSTLGARTWWTHRNIDRPVPEAGS